MQISQNQLVIVATGKQVVCRRGEAYASDISSVRFEALNGPTAPDVEEDAAAVLVTGYQKTSGWIDAESCYRTANLQRDQMLIRYAIPIPFQIIFEYVR